MRAAPWRRGRTLAERGEDLGGGPATASSPDARRLERWREDFPDEAALAGDGDGGDSDGSGLPAPYAVAVTLHGERILLGAANRSGGV